MPYYFDLHEPPEHGEKDLEQFREIWEVMKNDLMGVVFETDVDALEERNRPHKDESGQRYFNWTLVRFRKTDDRDMLLHFHDLGLEALTYTERALEQGRLDANFLHYWGMLSACHGYVTCAALASGNDLISERAGRAGRKANNLDKHKLWFAHYYLRERPNCRNRAETLERVARLINAITDGHVEGVPDSEWNWFEAFLSLDDEVNINAGGKRANPRKGELTKPFRKELSAKEMERLVKLPSDGLPSLELDIPPP